MVHATIVAHLDSQFSRDIASRIKDGLQSQEVIVNLVDVYNIDIGELINSDVIVFGCPTTMGSPSARFKEFMERTDQHLYNQQFKNKMAAGFTYGDTMSGDKFATIQALCNFAGQHSMIWISQGDILENEGVNSTIHLNPNCSYLGNISEINMNTMNTIVPIEFTETAYYFGRRIGATVNRWV
jgi:NAD(P)H dehydrogenase (quinone)